MWGLKNQFFDIPFSNNETMPFPKTSNRKDKPPEKEKTNIKLPSWIVECESGIKIEFTGKPNSKIEGVSFIDENELSIQVLAIIYYIL